MRQSSTYHHLRLENNELNTSFAVRCVHVVADVVVQCRGQTSKVFRRLSGGIFVNNSEGGSSFGRFQPDSRCTFTHPNETRSLFRIGYRNISGPVACTFSQNLPSKSNHADLSSSSIFWRFSGEEETSRSYKFFVWLRLWFGSYMTSETLTNFRNNAYTQLYYYYSIHFVCATMEANVW